METIIYTLSDPIDLSIKYVGKTIRPKERFKEHLKECGKYKKVNWIKKLLRLNLFPIMEELDRVPTENEDFWEIYWIAQVKAWGFELLNHTEGGHNPPIVRKYGKDNSFKKPEVEKKIMEMNHARKGKTYEELYGEERAKELRQKIKDRTQGEKNPRFGAVLSDETKNKIGAANSGERNGHYGKPMEEWHKKKLRESNTKGEVYQYNQDGQLIQVWDGLFAIKKFYGSDANVCGCIKGKRKTAYGYIWARKKPD